MTIKIIITIVALLSLSGVTLAEDKTALQRADAAYAQADFHRAALEYHRVLFADPTNEHAHLRLADYYLRLRQYGDAMPHAQAVLKHNARSVEALMILGQCHSLRDEHTQAQHYFEQVIALDPNNAGAYYNLGVVRRHRGDNAGSRAAFAKYRRLAGLRPDPADQEPTP